jgi:hypothetical protein
MKPVRSGWYWMLHAHEQPGLPTIVQIDRDWETGRLIVLIPPSRYPTLPGAVRDLAALDALWAGPLAIPSVGHQDRRVLRYRPDSPADIAA